MRLYWFSTFASPARSWRRIIRIAFEDVERLEAGDDDRLAVVARDELVRPAAGDRRDVPGPTKPSIRMSGESRIARIAGTIVTWLQKTEKFVTPSSRARRIVSAVEGAVVSKPIAKKQTCLLGMFCSASAARRAASRPCGCRRRAP
jgi:hypothetical protein